MMNLLSVDNIAFTVVGYPLSYIELVGTVLYLASVWLISRRNMLTWPVGIISVLLFMVLFYQIRLYADAIEQVYYLGASVY
ncbi:MAG: nicotinamide mononucleotide transporter family protein, partial [Chloroflexota bacterium]